MKKIIICIITFMLITPCIMAQTTPQGMKYQAIARDIKGEIMGDQPIELRMTLRGNDNIANDYYVETHHASTNKLGLFSLVIGNGDIQSGTFKEIPWSEENIWISIEIKNIETNAFTVISNSKLLAVPYAFHSTTASNLATTDSDFSMVSRPDGVPSQNWSLFGNRNSNPIEDKLGTTDSTDLVIVTNNRERLRVTADGQIITGDGKFTIGGNLEVQGDSTTINKDLYVGRNVVLNFDDGFNPRGETKNHGDFTVEEMSSTLLTGTLNVNKATDLDDVLNVDGETDLNSPLRVNNASSANFTGTVEVDGITDLNSALRVNNASETNLSGTLNVVGSTVLSNTLAANGQVTINAPVTGGNQDDITQYPLIVKGGDHGVAIQVNGTTPQRNTNFLTLFDGSGDAMGRIEGFQGLTGIGQGIIDIIMSDLEDSADEIDVDDEDSTTPPADIPPSVEQYFNNDYAVGALSETLDLANAILGFAINLSAALGLCIAGDCDDPVWAAIDAVVQGVQLAGYITYNELNLGAAFESGGADYAEWLKKAYSQEKIQFGEVVGVKGGVISKNFILADQFMVVSKNPTIIGAMPDAGFENDYKKIAFMGQVAVKVIGKVNLGDYILPTGNGDGMAVAIAPELMRAKDFSRIIGVSWSSSDGTKLFEYINTAVGLNTNDMALMIDNMQLVMNKMQEALAKLNPDYSPTYFDVSGEIQPGNISYTSAPTLNQIVTNQIGIDQSTKKGVALQKVRDYAKTVNLNFEKLPYFQEMLNNPDDEQLIEKAVAHYYKSTTGLTKVLDEVNKARLKKKK